MTDYIIFSLLFFIIRLVCYVIAGVVDLQLARKVYSGKNRLYKSFLRDMDNKTPCNSNKQYKTFGVKYFAEPSVSKSAFPTEENNPLRKPNRFILSNVFMLKKPSKVDKFI